jgi:hypothetical protein
MNVSKLEIQDLEDIDSAEYAMWKEMEMRRPRQRQRVRTLGHTISDATRTRSARPGGGNGRKRLGRLIRGRPADPRGEQSQQRARGGILGRDASDRMARQRLSRARAWMIYGRNPIAHADNEKTEPAYLAQSASRSMHSHWDC